MNREKVFVVDVFWDGPIAGAANLKGKPHYFDAVEDDAELSDGSINYNLIPLTDEIFDLITENNEIRLRWQNAFEIGKTDLETEPTLPEDKTQFDLNRERIYVYLYQYQSLAERKKGIFHQIESGYDVEWA